MSGIDHLGINAVDFEKSKAFYAAALKPLGIWQLQDYGMAVGYGETHPFLWLASSPMGGPPGPFAAETSAHLHLAFSAKDRAAVDAFYAAAIAAGGTDNGKPGLRPEYHENYYGAFVLDPDGHNIEAVCHAPA
jgi:catechol 2,3-dioxygenase-like lactoylglutathione lyase family enzyme